MRGAAEGYEEPAASANPLAVDAGSAQQQTQRVDAAKESKALEQAAERLATLFPQVDSAHVRQLVREVSAVFQDARVRDYVPVLVEREVKHRLRDEVAHPPLEPVRQLVGV
ncbi:MAG: hypothetical protein JWN36_573 [Microbacteriaceae bacterium]|nr:hypothetical protein [Microbacteriaceae bacterium]